MSTSSSQARQPLTELPLHLYVSQSLESSSKPLNTSVSDPKTPTRSRSPSLPLSQRTSRSVSPHKEAVLRSYRRVREGSISSTSVASLQSSTTDTQSQCTIEADAVLSPRKLFPSQQLPAPPALEQSTALLGSSMPTHFSPKNISKVAHHLSSRPTTPSDSKTTPSNLRLHRPSYTSGPKPTSLMEPSPSTQRFSEPRVTQHKSQTELADPVTPSRPRQLRAASPSESSRRDSYHLPALTNLPPDSTQLLKSLPKKKHRVSRTEIAIAHEEAGAGSIGSPSPCMVTDYMLPHNGVPKSIESWAVYEDPPLDDSVDNCPALSEDMHAHAVERQTSPSSSVATNSAPSTPNKENRLPDTDLLASKVVPIALPDRAYSASVVPTSSAPSRKRGTGGRLSLLANANDVSTKGKEPYEQVEPANQLSASKKSRNQDAATTDVSSSFTRKASQSRKASARQSPEGSRGRRKVSVRHTAQRDQTDGDQISCRTRSRT